jgi:cell wall-associated NlpC family hydrolase
VQLARSRHCFESNPLDSKENTVVTIVARRDVLAVVAGGVVAGALGVRHVDAKRASGSDIARFARRFEGERYVWAGNNPKQGFDCSGFTMFVVKRTLGTDITQSVAQQWRHGKRVQSGDWKPGDLVFFRNTSDRGLSHVGIFLRDRRFIHAEHENTGVVITDILSDYYRKHYAGAKRLT